MDDLNVSQAFLQGGFNQRIRQVDYEAFGSVPPSLRLSSLNDDELLLSKDEDQLLAEDDALLSGDSLLDSSEPQPETDLLGDDLLGDDLLGGHDPLSEEDPLLQPDPLTNKPSTSESLTDFDPGKMLPAGGWYRDDLRLSIRYRGGGHADPVLPVADRNCWSIAPQRTRSANDCWPADLSQTALPATRAQPPCRLNGKANR